MKLNERQLGIPCSEFFNGWMADANQMLKSEDRNQSKRVGLWESQPGF